MIWLILLLLAGLVGAYLLQPFFAARPASSDDRLAEARSQRAAIDLDETEGRLTADAAAQARDALDRRILTLLDGAPAASRPRDLRTAAVFLVPAILVLGAASVYVRIGSPSYEHVTVAEFQAAQVADLPQSLEGLVVELRNRLEADPNPPFDGYVLLARSSLRLGDAEAALEAYETAITLSNNDERVIAERDQVVEALRSRANVPQVDPEAAARIQSMSPEEQAAMIDSMVAGLAARLEDNPDDPQGWARLVRARMVLGQIDQAKRDLERAQAVFADRPETLALFEPLALELSETQ
nr:c-type cytochrome biogenesis protein CcmI [Hyphomonas sp. Mor2]